MSHQTPSEIPLPRRSARRNQASTVGVGSGRRLGNDENIMDSQQGDNVAPNTTDGSASVQQMEQDLARLREIITAQ